MSRTTASTPTSPDDPVATSFLAEAPRTRHIATIIVLCALLLAVLAGVLSRGTSAPSEADAPADDFSATRATDAVAPVVETPRPIGSAANAEGREYLTESFEQLGFDVEQQDAIGTRAGDGEYAGESTAAFTRNIVATRPGTDPTGTIVLATHHDSVPGAPGAADAGVGVAVILEAVRALGEDATRNDLVLLIVDGEEDGLLGARAFLEDGAQDLAEPVVVLNHEARGTSGRPLVTRWDGPMHQVMPAMPAPEAESFTDALFDIIPNDTDFTEYRADGWWGMDMAIIDDAWAYHTPQDDPEHLDASTLQHYGEMTLTMSKDLLARDLAAMATGEPDPVITTAPWGVLEVPAWLLLALAGLAPPALILATGIRAGRLEVTWRGMFLGAATALVTLALGVALAVAAWMAVTAIHPQMLSVVMAEPVLTWPFLAVEMLCVLIAAALAWAILRRWLTPAALGLGAALLGSLLACALTILSPQLGGWLMLPVAIAALGTLAVAALPKATSRGGRFLAPAIGILAVLPTGWVLGTQASALAEFGIASSNGMLALVVALSLFAAAPLLAGARQISPAARTTTDGSQPVAARPGRIGRRLLVPAAALVATVALAGSGILLQGGTGEPIQERVEAEADTDAGATTWTATGATEWGQDLDGTSVDEVAGLQAPECTLREGDGDRAVVEVSSPRGAQRITLNAQDGPMQEVTVDGTVAPEAREGTWSLRLLGLEPGQSARVEFTGDAAGLRCTDETHDPAEAAGWPGAPEEVSLVQPAIRVSGTASPTGGA